MAVELARVIRAACDWKIAVSGSQVLSKGFRSTIEAFGEESGVLVVGGVRVDRLAERVGSTPFFAYDRRLLTARIELLRRTLPAELHLSYAIKANPMPAVVQHLSALVDGLDVASASEMRDGARHADAADADQFRGTWQDPGGTDAGRCRWRHRSRWNRKPSRSVLRQSALAWAFGPAWPFG